MIYGAEGESPTAHVLFFVAVATPIFSACYDNLKNGKVEKLLCISCFIVQTRKYSYVHTFVCIYIPCF